MRTRLLCLAVVAAVIRFPVVSAQSAATPVATPIPLREVSVGIGALDLSNEATAATFDASRYFEKHPLLGVAGVRIQPKIADTKVDYEYTVTGRIEGRLTRAGAGARGAYVAGNVFEWSGAILGTTFLSVGHINEDTKPLRTVGAGFLLMVPVGLAMQHSAVRNDMKNTSRFERDLKGSFKLFRAGKKVKEFDVKAAGPFELGELDQPGGLRAAYLQPLWEGMGAELQSVIGQDLAVTKPEVTP